VSVMAGLRQPEFPPLLKGAPVGARVDPFDVALAAAQAGVEPGLVHYSESEAVLRAAITLEPDLPLARAMG